MTQRTVTITIGQRSAICPFCGRKIGIVPAHTLTIENTCRHIREISDVGVERRITFESHEQD